MSLQPTINLSNQNPPISSVGQSQANTSLTGTNPHPGPASWLQSIADMSQSITDGFKEMKNAIASFQTHSQVASSQAAPSSIAPALATQLISTQNDEDDMDHSGQGSLSLPSTSQAAPPPPAASGSSSDQARFDKLEKLLIDMNRNNKDEIDTIVSKCDKQLETRLDIFQESFFSELSRDKEAYMIAVGNKVKSYVHKHEVRRERRMKDYVQTSVKHYLAASLQSETGRDPAVIMADLDKLGPIIRDNIDKDIKAGSRRLPSHSQQSAEPRLNDSFTEIQDNFNSGLMDIFPNATSNLAAPAPILSPSVQLQEKQRTTLQSQAALVLAPGQATPTATPKDPTSSPSLNPSNRS